MSTDFDGTEQARDVIRRATGWEIRGFDGGMEELGACCGGSKMITWMMDENRNGGRRTDCRHSAHSVVHYDY